MSDLTVSRKGFLALGSAIGGVLASTGAFGASRASARPARKAAGAGTGGPLLDGSRFPIGVFWPPPPLESTVERYQQMVDAGFTYMHTGNYGWADVQIATHQLRTAQQVGLQVLVDDPDIRWLTRSVSISDDGGDFTITRREAEAKLREIIARYQPVRWWRVEDGRLLISGGTGNGSIGYSTEGEDWTDYTLSFSTSPRPTGAGGYAQSGWAFRVQDEGNAYVWLLNNQSGPGNLTKAVFVNGAPRVSVVPLGFDVVAGTTYRVETRLEGDTITTSVNGKVVDTTTDATFASGPVGFRQAGNESAYYDDVRVVDASGRELLSEDFSGGLDQWRTPGGGGFESFAGIHLYDEPTVPKLADLGALAEIIRSIDPDVLPYINHFPGFDYEAAMEQTTPELLSFDRYPILSSGEDVGYFANWAAVREAALPTDTPTWAFIQSVGYANHAVPTKADLYWQTNISLAYGCKGIQYFTYWTPDPARGEGFHDGIVLVDGTLTPLYDATREVNTEWLAPVGLQLLPLRSEAVQAANLADVPAGLDTFEADDEIASVSGDAVVLGRFTGPDEHRYVLLANYSRHEAATVELRWGSAVQRVASFNPGNESYRNRGRGRFVVELGAGEAHLVRVDPR
ncbi:hypothetical protein GC722_00885 [Auraticoccus sp. F435]|uniref:Glycoside hydrolase family 42 N-terminal domain-containing protein n=1 Tax=Auraticoccus cholistanensis TaxID=2656650 RepID=A0A6A9UTS5_9ACTN|nr:hypothetical protein [Auraticoccus cholistanensis]MVA74597.1 hypothetical protein [Auraticoccus cholistanensis]